jgi:hypothetical protein
MKGNNVEKIRKKIKEKLENPKNLSYCIIFLSSIFICLPLFSQYMDISRDDGIQHICRLIGTFNTLKEGNLFPVIISEFCNEFGYSWNLFYSPLTAYLPLIFKIITKSYVVCLKLFMFVSMLLSGIYMYKFVYKITKNNKASVLSAIIYITAPYHLTDLYNRIAIAELTSFIFLPIIFEGMYDIFNKNNTKSYHLSIGAIGLILTHNVIAVYTAIFCFIYMILNYKKLKEKGIIKIIVINIFIIITCTSFYWIPLLQHYFAATYEVFVPGRMFQNNTLISSKLNLSDLIYSKHYGMIFHLGLPIILGIILLIIYKNHIKKSYKKTIFIFLFFGIISVIMTLKLFPFEILPNFLKMIQFQWRMMEFANFFLSIISGIGIAIYIKKLGKKDIVLIIALIIYTVILLISSKHTVKQPFKEDNYLKAVKVTNLTGRVHAGCASFEYLPQKAFSNREYIETRENKIIVMQGDLEIIFQEKINTNLKAEFVNIQEDTIIELPYIYYLGYNAEFVDEQLKVYNLKIEESENGFLLLKLPPKEKGTLNISYKGTNYMKISYIITILGILMLIKCIKFSNIKKII